MNRLLDIDLDFFLADCCPLADKGKRPDLTGHEPLNEKDVRRFLEQNLGLSKHNPIPARLFETHDKALSFWQELINSRKISTPFCVTHIDAHSDLGIGYPGPGYVLNTVICTKPEKRIDIDRYYSINELDEANYLLFALGFRWIAELDNIRNPLSRRDVPKDLLLKDESGNINAIQLKSFASQFLRNINGDEPITAYRQYDDYDAYKSDCAFDYGSLAISPRYAPKEADELIDIIGEYLRFE